MIHIRILSLLVAILLLIGCTSKTVQQPLPQGLIETETILSDSPIEQPVLTIPLQGPVSERKSEISGMAWYGDYLVLLPQYPDRFSSNADGVVFSLSRADIIHYLDGVHSGPLHPTEISLAAPGLRDLIEGFEGFEAIAFHGDKAFLTIESKPGPMLGYIIAGRIAPDLGELSLDTSSLSEIPPQAPLENMSDETLFVIGQQLVTFYEANGLNVNPSPVAHLFDFSLQPLGTLPIPNIEYRITDASETDEQGRFWVINYFYPGDQKLQPAPDLLVAQFGEGPTHARFNTVERLLEFQVGENEITLTETPPVQLQLIDDDHARNWEAIARLGERGFLLATDLHPETILGFISYP